MSKDGKQSHGHRRIQHGHSRAGYQRVAWAQGEVVHKPAELTVAEQTKLLLLLETNPLQFMQKVNLWRATNPSDTMNLGSAEAPVTIAGLDMAPYKGFDLNNVSLAGITLKDANFTDESTADAFHKAGASLLDYTVGESAAASRMQPRLVRAQTVAAIADKPVVGDNTAAQRARADAAALNAYARSSGRR